MVKHFNIIMAGVISGIVALFTSWLGISGTVIGSVLSSFLYQLLSTYYDEKTKDIDFSNVKNRNSRNSSSKDNGITNKVSDKINNSTGINKINPYVLAHKIAFIFPVFVILIVECLFCLTDVSYSVSKVFYLLEAVTDQNLLRVMGISLVIVSIYPFIKPDIIKKRNGIVLLIVGALLFLRGIMDIHPVLSQIYYLSFDRIDLLGVLICIILFIVIISVLIPSNTNEKSVNRQWGAKKINTNFNNPSDNYVNLEDNFDRNNNFNKHSIKNRYVDDFDIAPNNSLNHQDNYNPNNYTRSNYTQDNYVDSSSFIPNNRNDKIYVDDYGEPIPIYEEDYIYVTDPNNPNRTVKKKILKKISKNMNRPKRR